MLSILIPTYDYTCYQLVSDLHQQAERLDVPYEIVVAEDGSRSQVNIIANHKIAELSHCRHIVNKENLGRAEVRNFLAREAQYDWILFIDSDAKVGRIDFLASYVQQMGRADVVAGGLNHPKVNYDPNVTLRYRYEKAADLHRSAAERSLHPYRQFATFNFMIRRVVFLDILFDKDCTEYGYEDALFGQELQRRGIGILHIDNPLTHMGLDTNEAFLKKSETALCTLKKLGEKMEGHSHVGRTYMQLNRLHLAWAMRLFFHVARPVLRRHLLSKNPSLFWFAVYKLGFYAAIR